MSLKFNKIGYLFVISYVLCCHLYTCYSATVCRQPGSLCGNSPTCYNPSTQVCLRVPTYLDDTFEALGDVNYQVCPIGNQLCGYSSQCYDPSTKVCLRKSQPPSDDDTLNTPEYQVCSIGNQLCGYSSQCYDPQTDSCSTDPSDYF